MSQPEMPLDAALDLVRGWTEGLAALPPPTEEDFQGFSGATDSPMRTYLAVLRSVDSPREVPIEQHFAAVSYLREHSRTQLPRELWEKAFESIRSAWERKMGSDPRMQEAAKRGVARAKAEAEELKKKKVETYQKKVKEFEEKTAAHEAAVAAKANYEKRLKAGETGAEEAPPVVPPKPRKPRPPKEEGGVETERAVGKATDEELFAREFLTGDMSDVRPNGVNSGSVRGGSWVWLPEQGVLQVKTGLSPGHRLKTAHLAEAGVKGFLDVAADFTWNIPADSIMGFADLLDAGWPVVAKALRMFSPKWKAPAVGAPGAGGQAAVERKSFSGDAREGRSLSGNPWQWAWSPQNPKRIKLLVPYSDIQGFPVRGQPAFVDGPNGRKQYWWSYNISDLDAIISHAMGLSPGFVKAAEAFQSTWNPEAPPVDTSGVEITPIGVTPEQKEAEKKATYRGTAAKGTAFGRENWQWSWNKTDPDTLLLQFPVRGATKQELAVNANTKIPVVSRSVPKEGVYWRAYPLDQLDEILKTADNYCEGLRDAAGAFSATWLTREAVSEQALLRARFLVRKFKHMMHPDVRGDESKLEGILAKVAPLLERVVLGTLKVDLGPNGAFEVLFNDSDPNQSQLKITLNFERNETLRNMVRGARLSSGTVWFSIRKTPDVARALDLISPPLAIALRLAWLIDPDLFQRGDRNCGPLQEIAGALHISDIVDPTIRAQAAAIYERTRKFLTIDPYDYQKVGIAYLELSNWRALVGDAPGLGKTLQALSALAANREILTPALVVCPLSVKLNWVKEAEKFTPGLRGRGFETEKRVVLKRKAGNVEKTIPATDLSALQTGDFVTTTWNSVDDNFNTFKDAGFKCVIFDESHWLKSTKSARYKACKALAEGIPHVIELSGTAMEAKPEDLWPQLNIIDPVVFSNFYEFKNRYGDGNKRTVGKITFQDDWGLEKKSDAPEEEEEEDETPDDEDGGGTSRRRKRRGVTARQLAVLGELREDLRCFMVRRMKHELGNQIPEKTRQLLWNDLPPDLRKAYDLVRNNLVEWVVKAKETALTRAAVTWLKHEKNVQPLGVKPLPRFPSVEAWREWLKEPGAHEAIEAATKAILEELGDYDPTKQMQLKAVGYLRRILGVAKARIAAEMIPEFLEETGGTEQLIVVIEHKKPFEILKAALDKHKIAWTFIVGGVPLEKRQQRAEDFLKKKYQVIILSRAATEGINLFSASNVLFVERMWVPSKEEQLEDRSHRSGQKSNVNVRYLMANDTFDERIAEIVDNKRALTEAVLRGEGTKGILKYGGAEKQKLSLKGLLDLKLGREKTVSLTPEMVTDAIRKGGDPKEEAPKFEEDSTDSELEGSDMDMEEESGRSGPLPPGTTGSGPSIREFHAWVGARTDVFSERYGVPAETLQSWITPERMAQIDPRLGGFSTAFEAAFERLRRERRVNLVPLLFLRQALPTFSREDFDRNLYELRKEQRYVLESYDGRHGKPPEDQIEAGILEGGRRFIYVSKRDE